MTVRDGESGATGRCTKAESVAIRCIGDGYGERCVRLQIVCASVGIDAARLSVQYDGLTVVRPIAADGNARRGYRDGIATAIDDACRRYYATGIDQGKSGAARSIQSQ